MLWEVAHKTYLNNIQAYLDDRDISLADCESAIQISHRHLLELLEVSKSHGFESEKDEIRFFKEIQSGVYGHLIYFKQVSSVLLKGSLSKSAFPKKRLKKALASFRKAIKRNQDFYHYILLDKNHLDDKYFTRSASKHGQPNTTFLFDPKCTTPHCLLLGEIIGYRLFSKYLTSQSENKYQAGLPKCASSLKWTGKKVDLIELVYALHASGVFNHGNASIRTIADSLQEQFGCPIGDIYRSYTDLRYRKKSRTKFLEELTVKLSQKMESEEA